MAEWVKFKIRSAVLFLAFSQGLAFVPVNAMTGVPFKVDRCLGLLVHFRRSTEEDFFQNAETTKWAIKDLQRGYDIPSGAEVPSTFPKVRLKSKDGKLTSRQARKMADRLSGILREIEKPETGEIVLTKVMSEKEISDFLTGWNDQTSAIGEGMEHERRALGRGIAQEKYWTAAFSVVTAISLTNPANLVSFGFGLFLVTESVARQVKTPRTDPCAEASLKNLSGSNSYLEHFTFDSLVVRDARIAADKGQLTGFGRQASFDVLGPIPHFYYRLKMRGQRQFWNKENEEYEFDSEAYAAQLERFPMKVDVISFFDPDSKQKKFIAVLRVYRKNPSFFFPPSDGDDSSWWDEVREKLKQPLWKPGLTPVLAPIPIRPHR